MKLSVEDLIPFLHLGFSSRHRKMVLLLKILENEKEMPQYQLPKHLDCGYRIVLRLVHLLEDYGFTEIVRTAPSSKGGKEQNIWSLTEKGSQFLHVLGE